MTTPIDAFREAVPADVPALVTLVRTAYRGEVGWTTETALLDDERIDASGVADKIANPRGAVLVAVDAMGTIIGCCELIDRGDGLAYFGMFAVDPSLQAAGLGRQLLARAEQHAASIWRTRTMEMTVIAQRQELIAWYVRRGYLVSDETRPFPYDQLVNGSALRDDLYFAVLTRAL
ncbi:GNAT family N-acetyltransferase [Lapillicoccus sp.]|uniref:GNAT family N-acetyltransferase n=1 Tax=Lapillicoccus sp. TaxID=1909287 RepID=UPI0025E22F48|nr:GNAT family N-acetyltransferase [Lapillicoccus sp.]